MFLSSKKVGKFNSNHTQWSEYINNNTGVFSIIHKSKIVFNKQDVGVTPKNEFPRIIFTANIPRKDKLSIQNF